MHPMIHLIILIGCYFLVKWIQHSGEKYSVYGATPDFWTHLVFTILFFVLAEGVIKVGELIKQLIAFI